MGLKTWWTVKVGKTGHIEIKVLPNRKGHYRVKMWSYPAERTTNLRNYEVRDLVEALTEARLHATILTERNPPR